MAFSDKEISNEDGKPIALYTLRWGETFWRYTSADADVTRMEILAGPDPEEVLYISKAVSDNGMVQGGSQENDFTMQIPADLPIVPLFRSTPVSDSIFMTVRRIHPGEADAPIYWIGTVGNVRRLDLANAEVIGRTLTATFKRTGLRLAWTRGCPHMLYDGECKANKALFKSTTTIVAMTGNTIDVEFTGHEDDPSWFAGGFIEWVVNEDGTIDRRGIERESTSPTELADELQRLVIFGTTDRLEIGMEIDLYAGCDRSPVMCDEKFDNLPNYGGFQYLAGKTPFEGSPIF
jgi:uncharacterized phage protein (TIGR02218 family)